MVSGGFLVLSSITVLRVERAGCSELMHGVCALQAMLETVSLQSYQCVKAFACLPLELSAADLSC